MSTKQTILYTLMIFFLVMLLVSLGAWFKSSMDLNTKKNIDAALKDRGDELKTILEGGAANKKTGLKFQVDDEQEGLSKRLTDALTAAANAKSNPDVGNPGYEQRLAAYMALE